MNYIGIFNKAQRTYKYGINDVITVRGNLAQRGYNRILLRAYQVLNELRAKVLTK